MKTFNKVIKVEVSVDSIAVKLLESFKGSEFKHAELLTEAIIGSSLSADNLSYVYNALNGYSAEIDFKVGELIAVEGLREYSQGTHTPVLFAEIVEIDLYKEQKLKVKWNNLKGSESVEWVKHTNAKLYVNTEVTDVSADAPVTDFSQAH